MRKIVLFACSVLISTAAFAGGSWCALGEEVLKFDGAPAVVETDDTSVDALRLSVNKRAIRVTDVVVTYADGSEERIAVGANCYPGGSTDEIAIKGGEIETVAVSYDTLDASSKGRTRLSVFGRG